MTLDRSRCRCHERGVVAAVLIGLLASAPAPAAEPADESPPKAPGKDETAAPKQEAKALFLAGQRHYNLNEYSQALEAFKEAYRLFPDPVFLYNLGQCERQLGHAEEAIRFYRSFLREQPRAPNRQEVLKKIDELEELQKSRPDEQERKDETNAPPPALPAAASQQTGAPAPLPDTSLGSDGQGSMAGPKTAPLPESGPPASTAAILGDGPALSPTGPARTAPGIDVTAAPEAGLRSSNAEPPTSTTTASKPFYATWWFWTAASAVAIAATVGIYAATSSGGATPPPSDLGAKKVF